MQIFGQIKAVQLQLFCRNYNKLQNTNEGSSSFWTGTCNIEITAANIYCDKFLNK